MNLVTQDAYTLNSSMPPIVSMVKAYLALRTVSVKAGCINDPRPAA